MAFAEVEEGVVKIDHEGETSGDGLYKLGLMFSTGQGVPVNLVEAHKWFNLAALKGSLDAKAHRGEVAEQMSKTEIAQAQRAAREWLRESA
ncbi:MAG: hypothetical protein ACFB2Z_07460 [Maricaulaceae bacterium]